MPAWTARARPGLAEGALEDVGTLARQLHSAQDSHVVTARRCAEMEERLLALVEAVGVCGGDEDLLRSVLRTGDPDLACAAALVSLGMPAARGLLEAAWSATPVRWWPVLYAHAWHYRQRLQVAVPAASSAGVPGASWMMTVLRELAHPGVRPGLATVTSGVADPVSAVRCAAWWFIGHGTIQVDPGQVRRGCGDDDAAVRHACVEALVWTRHPVFAHLVGEALHRRSPADHEIIRQWCRLVPRSALAQVLGVIPGSDQGLARIDLLLAIGLPDVVPAVLALMAAGDQAVAVAAGQAFWALTGRNVDSARRVALSPGPASDPLDAELQPTGWLPDQEQAARIWADLAPRLDPDLRLSAGRQGPDENAAAEQDLATAYRVSAHMRRVYFHGDVRVV